MAAHGALAAIEETFVGKGKLHIDHMDIVQ